MESTRKYLISGHEVEVIEKTQAGYIVTNVYEDEDGNELTDGKRFFIENVYDKPPVGKLSTQITSLQEEVTKLYETRKALTSEIKEAQTLNDDLLKKFKRNKQLKQLEDFIDGKITHYVVFDYRWEILEFKNAKSESDYSKDKLKLLTLFGLSNGDLSWGLNKYYDGSGHYSEAYPCTSYEQALTIMQNALNERVKNDKNTDYRIIETAQKYNLTIDPEYVKRYNNYLKQRYVENLEKKRKEIIELERSISEIPE